MGLKRLVRGSGFDGLLDEKSFALKSTQTHQFGSLYSKTSPLSILRQLIKFILLLTILERLKNFGVYIPSRSLWMLDFCFHIISSLA